MWSLRTRNRRNRETTCRIPSDVILEILSWLPAKSILRFNCVCKEWCNLINSPLFAKLHLNKSLQSDSRHNQTLFCTTDFHIVDHLYTLSEVVGSGNGLVCFKIYSNTLESHFGVTCFLICNPTTGTFKLIHPSLEEKWTGNFLRYGFGYDSELDDYKIIVTRKVWTESDRDVCIYSVKADLWRSLISPTRVPPRRRWEHRENAIYRNNTLHYLVSAEILGDGSYGVAKDYLIARFDVVTEKWRDDLSLPQLNNMIQFGELDGRLYLRAGNPSTEVWMLEENGSWKMMFHLPKKISRHILIGRSKDRGRRLLFYDQHKRELKWYDDQDSKIVPFALKVPTCYSSVMLCIASVVTIPGCSSYSYSLKMTA